jgi:hypothetical protein
MNVLQAGKSIENSRKLLRERLLRKLDLSRVEGYRGISMAVKHCRYAPHIGFC